MFAAASPNADLDALRKLLADNARQDFASHNYSKNHVSMTLTALYFLGGTRQGAKAVMEECVRYYTDVVVSDLAKSDVPVYGALMDFSVNIDTEADLWGKCVGDRSKFSVAARYLRDTFPQDGEGTEKRTWLAQYLSNAHIRTCLASSAFHGLIRIAYGLDCGSDVDVICGVATIITSAILPPAPLDGADFTAEVKTSLDSALEDSKLTGCDFYAGTKKGGVDGRVQVIWQQESFVKTLPRLDGDQLERVFWNLQDSALWLFDHYHDFSALHGVDGMVALRRVLDEVRGPIEPHVIGEMLSGFWAYFLAVALTLPDNKKRRNHRKLEDNGREVPETSEEELSKAGLMAIVVPVLETAHKFREEMPSTYWEHLVKLLYALFCIVYHARETAKMLPEKKHLAEHANQLERRCIALALREAKVSAVV
jgi:hypothetical protein